MAAFFFVYLPYLMSFLGIIMMIAGARRKRKQSGSSKWLFIFGGILTMFPLEAYIIGWILVVIALL